jgi:uncharacterized membrane protein YfcA
VSAAAYLLILVAGFLAGIINTLSGAGSFITLPVLIALGLPATVANGTNRVGVLLQNIVAGYSFGRDKVLDGRGALLLSAPAVLGSLLGANIAVKLNEDLMQRSIGIVMVLMLAVILFQPRRWLEGRRQNLEGGSNWVDTLLMFAVGMYGGFIQAGVGIFLLAALVLSVGYDLVRANAVKIIIVLAFTMSSLFVFANNAQVDWGAGFLLGAGNMLGAWVAARMAVRRGAAWIRWVVVVTVAASALYLLGALDLLAGLFS